MVPLAAKELPSFGDFTNEVPYDEALSLIMQSEQAFRELPSDERKKYHNDPREYYEATLKEAYERQQAEDKLNEMNRKKRTRKHNSKRLGN